MPDRSALASQIAAVDSAITAGGVRRASAMRPRRGAAARAGAPEVDRVPTDRPAKRPDAPAPRSVEPVRIAVDVDRADAVTLDRLPGIGPALAARIVADRDARGPFGSLQALERVKGIGPALAARLGPHVTFSLAPRPSDTGVPLREGVVRP